MLLTILFYGFYDVMHEVFAVTCVHACAVWLASGVVQC